MTREANRLYDDACELLIAARELRDAVARGGELASAIPATIGCIGATATELAQTLSALADELEPTRATSERAALVDRLAGQLLASARTCDAVRASLVRSTTAP